jgi:hypothetical protein
MIPKIIHQIWIGNKVKPKIFLDSFKNMHPDYEYILWNENEIKKRNMIFECQKQIDDNDQYCGKSDIMRYEILYKYGGIYIDADTYCLERIDSIMQEESFHYENEDLRKDLVANGFIIVKPNNPIIKSCIDEIKNINNISNFEPHIVTGSSLLTKKIKQFKDNYIFKILPSYTFLSYYYTNDIYTGSGKVYGYHFWGSTIFTEFNYNSNKLRFNDTIINKCKNNNNNNFTNFVINYDHNSKIINLPHILWINLDRSIDRYDHIIKLFNYNNIINHTRISAIDGNLISTEEINYKVGKNVYATLKSHLKAIKYYVDNKNEIGEYCMIVEDDISFDYVKYWKKSFQEYIDDFPKDWEIIKLFNNYEYVHNIPEKIKISNLKDEKSYGLVCYIINYNTAIKILDYYIDFKNINHDDLVADRGLYDICNTYSLPLFTYRNNNNSYIIDSKKWIEYTDNIKNNVTLLWENNKHY